MTRPDLQAIQPHFRRYVEHVKDVEVLDALSDSGRIMQELVKGIPEAKSDYRYEPGKWSIRELLCHLMDAERIFAYRALRFARNDKTPLPGFEENDYAPQANAHSRSLVQLAGEMQRLRTSTIDLFRSFTPEMLQRTGTSNNTEISALSLGYIIAGHDLHHRKIMLERYLNS